MDHVNEVTCTVTDDITSNMAALDIERLGAQYVTTGLVPQANKKHGTDTEV